MKRNYYDVQIFWNENTKSKCIQYPINDKIIETMKQDINFAETMLDVLLDSQEPNVKILACNTALDIDYKTEKS